MSAAVAQRNSPHMPRSSSRNQSPMDKKLNVKKEDTLKESSKPSTQKDTTSPPRPEAPTVDIKQSPEDRKDNSKSQPAVSNAEAAQPLAPPPKPSQAATNEGPDYFSGQHGNSHYSLEPNLFEQSFQTGSETPGKSLLPPVASLTSPQLLTGGGSIGSGYWQGGSLRSGPLSPAMLSGPAGPGDYFDSSLRGSFPTPNESSLRTGLTPGGGGSMFPAPSPNTQALFNSLASGGATPNTLEFQRTALNAAVANKSGLNPPNNTQTSQATSGRSQPMAPTSQAPSSNSQFAQHDNEAANGLYLLAQAGNESQSNNQFAAPPQPAHVNDKRNNGSIGDHSARGQSENSENQSDGESKQNSRKSKRASGGKANNKRKNEDTPAKSGSKKTKSTPSSKADNMSFDGDSDQEPIEMQDHDENGRKMTDEEKRKNFLERNRVAALKCRQRKKQWLANLQAKVEIFSTENDALNSQVSSLREEILNLKTILIAHKDCPISQNQQQTMGNSYLPPGNGEYQNHPYMGMQQGQPVMTGPRRFS